jgi:hypothetical protein
MAFGVMNEQETQSVIALLRAREHARAVVAIRRFTGCGLQEAIRVLRALEKEFGLTEQGSGDKDMGMAAEIIAIGPFSSSIVEHMEYPADFYRETRAGVPVLRRLFTVYQGSTVSREMAACFGIEAWDFNQHHLNPMRADVEKLRTMFDARDADAFLALRDAGFQFYFMPNG